MYKSRKFWKFESISEMTTVVLVIHIMVAVALVGTVLLQRSEGGALGIGGGGGGGGGFLSGRGAANMLTRTTAVLAVAFFATSIALTLIATNTRTGGGSIIDSTAGSSSTAPVPAAPVPAKPAEPQVPVSQ